jgi:hypothetical protein
MGFCTKGKNINNPSMSWRRMKLVPTGNFNSSHPLGQALGEIHHFLAEHGAFGVDAWDYGFGEK